MSEELLIPPVDQVCACVCVRACVCTCVYVCVCVWYLCVHIIESRIIACTVHVCSSVSQPQHYIA